jgi:Zn-dependent peptidase ImmA (M78 family)
MPAIEVPITGSVLAWAVSEAGFTPVQAASRLGVDLHELDLWISGAAMPSKGDFDRLCKLLDRPESFFFLAEPPVTTPTTASFRNPPGQREYRPSPNDLKLVRSAENVQQVAQWLAARAGFQFRPVAARAKDPVEPVASRVREWLNWSTAAQMRLTDYQAVRLMRASLEDQGITALNLQLGDSGLRGFCLPDALAPVVAINTHDDTRARIFSYIHECAHLSLGGQYLCQEYSDTRVERWCDRLAGAVLMPGPELRRHLVDENLTTVATYEQVRKAANKFNVSYRAMAVRLEQLQLCSEGLFDMVDAQAAEASRGGFGRGPARTRARIRLQRYGAGYINRLVNATRSGDLRDADVQDLLQLSRREYKELHQILAQGVEE